MSRSVKQSHPVHTNTLTLTLNIIRVWLLRGCLSAKYMSVYNKLNIEDASRGTDVFEMYVTEQNVRFP